MMSPDTQLITQLNEVDFSIIPAAEFVCPSHLHHFHQLDIILAGEVLIQVGGKAHIKARRGTIVLIPPLCRHAYHSQRGFQQISFKLHLSPRHWARFGEEHRCMTLPGYHLEELENCGRHWQEKSPLAHQHAVAAASLCLISLAETLPAAPVIPHDDNALLPQLWSLLEAVEARPYDAWAVSDLARSCHLSIDHFSRSFHHLLGTAPQRYLLEARMRAAAADLLNDPSRPIKHIAEAAGYANVHGFSRAFKAIFLTSPAAYRHAPRQF